jgi:hypothetical protein
MPQVIDEKVDTVKPNPSETKSSNTVNLEHPIKTNELYQKLSDNLHTINYYFKWLIDNSQIIHKDQYDFDKYFKKISDYLEEYNVDYKDPRNNMILHKLHNIIQNTSNFFIIEDSKYKNFFTELLRILQETIINYELLQKAITKRKYLKYKIKYLKYVNNLSCIQKISSIV